jgi:phosphatidylglycerol---prolipoprotein diacylglyceryl transferase
MIDPVAVQIGPFQLHWYGIIIALAVLLAAMLAARVAQRLGENPEHVWSMLLWVVVAGVVGARLYHVIHEWQFYAANPGLIPQIWNGGLGIYGAVAGGILAVLLWTRANRLNTARWLDIAAPAVLVGQAVGRLGNFVNQELYGPPVEVCGTQGYPPCLPFGIPIDAAHRAGTPWDPVSFPAATTQFVPLFAYEAILNLIGLAVLLFVVRRYAHRLYAGDLILMYFIWYGLVRTVLEPYRAGTGNWIVLGVPTAMWIGILAAVASAAIILLRHRWGRGSPMVRAPDATRDADGPAADVRREAETSAG